MKSINGALSRLETLLRFVAPGFLLFFALWAVDSNDLVGRLSSPMLSLGAALAGVMIYALHTGLLLRNCFWPYVVRHLLKRSKWIKEKDKEKTVTDMMFELDTQRWMRRASKIREIRMMQAELDRWAAMVNFLYCSGYALMLASFFLCVIDEGRHAIIVFGYGALGLLLVFFASISNCGMTDRAIWLANFIPDVKPPKIRQRKTVPKQTG